MLCHDGTTVNFFMEYFPANFEVHELVLQKKWHSIGRFIYIVPCFSLLVSSHDEFVAALEAYANLDDMLDTLAGQGGIGIEYPFNVNEILALGYQDVRGQLKYLTTTPKN